MRRYIVNMVVYTLNTVIEASNKGFTLKNIDGSNTIKIAIASSNKGKTAICCLIVLN